MNSNLNRSHHRVVITGVGAISAFGAGAEQLWQNLLQGNNGLSAITHLPISGEIVAIAGAMPDVNENITDDAKLKEMQTLDPSIPKFFLAVAEAISQAGLDIGNIDQQRLACMVADRPFSPTSIMEHYLPSLIEAAPSKQLGDLDIGRYWQALQSNTALRQYYQAPEQESLNHFIARYYQLSGPCLSIGTACASGNNAIGEAFLKIQQGELDCAIVGGAYDFDVNSMVGFTRIGALTTHKDADSACRPFDLNRSGFVMGSGCGILVLESLAHAKARGTTILAEVSGYASFSDGYRATDPDPSGMGARRTLQGALDCAGLKPEHIGYINAHGTSTKMNDRTETNAIKAVFGEHAYRVPISSTKSMIGHGIMAAGALEAIACIYAMRDNMIHGTRNYHTPDPELDLDYVPETKRELHFDHALSNNFGFGGQNASVIFSRFKAKGEVYE
ncbi:beta-ketoacyl-[acyl-carrier-protein] synthase family protein [Motilimonas eburnea]|uniref:beta-ketoacyl-[acyl-carrier-protein] synthase family protein n=1 Tax=Motilimonas eburnea TaxID=1737488 RepID=UPI001E42B66F|nr:beta-ketoacyl-[acyl-carrier-protein] synthase family protein [Motilimonas eburnea]MCE2570359.1 beta-ketoacyl-[acyl-carrier-protein] synthase family protein [Motilimonas eburnea]